MNSIGIIFKSKSFCFTGKLSEFKKVSDAENEIKDRAGYILEKVTTQLDYLIVGSIPSPDWKHGSFGTKIEAALKLNSKAKKPQIIHETDLISALLENDREDFKRQGQKILLLRVQFMLTTLASEIQLIDSFLKKSSSENDFHFTKKVYDISQFSFLSTKQEGQFKVEYRILKHLYSEETGEKIKTLLKNEINQFPEIDARILYSEKFEGSSEFLRLLKEIPDTLKLQ